MSRTTALLAAACCLLPSWSTATGATGVPTPAELARFADRELAAAYPADGPGAAVLVRWRGEAVLRRGYGLADFDLGVMVAPEQVFEIGSVTKQFTAAAILRLAEQGKLALGDPLTRFLPGFQTFGETITLEQLLNHTAGIPNYTDLPEWIPRWREDMDLDTLIGLFRGKPLDFPPGTSWSYSNSGYVLLGAVIERVSGGSYEDYVENELFAPLSLHDTRYGHQEELVRGRVKGYVKGPSGWINAPYLSLTQPFAAGALMSTVDDLARWSDALEAGRVISPASRDRMFTAALLRGGAQEGVTTRYGLGNALGEIAGHQVHEHGGGIHGFVSDLLRVPEEDLLVVLLSNNPTVDAHGLAHRIAERALGGAPPAPPAIALTEAELDAYVGVYLVPEKAGDRRQVTRRGTTLRLQRTGGSLHPLVPRGHDAFEIAEDRTAVTFERDATGAIAALRVDIGIGPVFRSTRTSEPLAPERVALAVADTTPWAAFVGAYALAPGFDLVVTREAGRLFAQLTGQARLELFAEGDDRFFFAEVDAQVEFRRVAPGGAVNALVLRQGGQDLAAKRKP